MCGAPELHSSAMVRTSTHQSSCSASGHTHTHRSEQMAAFDPRGVTRTNASKLNPTQWRQRTSVFGVNTAALCNLPTRHPRPSLHVYNKLLLIDSYHMHADMETKQEWGLQQPLLWLLTLCAATHNPLYVCFPSRSVAQYSTLFSGNWGVFVGNYENAKIKNLMNQQNAAG